MTRRLALFGGLSLTPALVGGGAAALFGAWYLSGPGRSVETALGDMSGLLLGSTRLSAAQSEMAQLITSKFARAGYGRLGIAAVANAQAESRLDPTAIGDGGQAAGLFQVHPWGGSLEQRLDPEYNIAAILSDPGIRTVASYLGQATNAELAALFAQYVERCGLCGKGGAELVNRSAWVSRLYGAAVASEVP